MSAPKIFTNDDLTLIKTLHAEKISFVKIARKLHVGNQKLE